MMMQFLRHASPAQFLFRLNGRIDVRIELGRRVNKEGGAYYA